MENCVTDTDQSTAFNIALSYHSKNAPEWYIMCQISEEGRKIERWKRLREEFIQSVETRNRHEIAGDKVGRWDQVKDVATFND